MSRSVVVTAVLACLAVAILTACGSDDSGGSSTADNAAATNAKTTAPAAASTAAPAPAPAPATTATTPSAPKDKATVVTLCHKTFDPFLAQLRKIEKMVDGTPRFATYRAATKKLEADYSAFNVGSIPNDSCLKFVSVPTTMSSLTHIKAAKEWADCRKRDNCSKAMSTIKKEWREATRFYVKGRTGFAKVTAD